MLDTLYQLYSQPILTTCIKWADGLYLYQNRTNYENESVVACVPDWTLADANYVNNPLTREWEYCGDSCVSCSSKYGCERCDGLDDNHSVSFTTFNVTGYGTDFAVWHRWHSVTSYCEKCTLNSTKDGILWLGWGYGIPEFLWGSCSQTSTCSAYCDYQWKAWYEKYSLTYVDLGLYLWDVWDYENWGAWNNASCTKCIDGYSFDTRNDWNIEWATESYYYGDWKAWNITTHNNRFDSCEQCHSNLTMGSESCSTICSDTEYIEYNLVSTSTELYHYREWERCTIQNWYQWAGIDSYMCESCMNGYYLIPQGSSSG